MADDVQHDSYSNFFKNNIPIEPKHYDWQADYWCSFL